MTFGTIIAQDNPEAAEAFLDAIEKKHQSVSLFSQPLEACTISIMPSSTLFSTVVEFTSGV
jgi:hypothetical protein